MRRLTGNILGIVSAVAVTAAAAAGCRGMSRAAASSVPQAASVSSSAFPPGGTIPIRFTCSGENVSPALSWSGLPAGTRSIALVLDDPDAPRGTFTHWILYELPPGTSRLAENFQPEDGAHEGTNDFGKRGYGGPCPPPGKPHHYRFRVLALDRPTGLRPGADRPAFDRATAGHVLAQGELVGLFAR